MDSRLVVKSVRALMVLVTDDGTSLRVPATSLSAVFARWYGTTLGDATAIWKLSAMLRTPLGQVFLIRVLRDRAFCHLSYRALLA